MFGELQHPSVLVLGLGQSGLAMARWCARYGCRLRMADTRYLSLEQVPNSTVLNAWRSMDQDFRTAALARRDDEGSTQVRRGGATPPARLSESPVNAEFVGGAFTPALIDGDIDLIGISPGLSPLAADLKLLLDAARARGIPIWSEIEFFSQALNKLRANGYAPKLLAITGTNGKTTTTALTGLLCKRAGKTVAVAGNIGLAVLDKLSDAIDTAQLPDIWVLELSSFQLETTLTFSPDAAAVLNITQDHLDWHGSFDAYIAAKGRIFGPSTLRVLNRDDACVMAFASTADRLSCLTFGLDRPEYGGDFGLECVNRDERLPRSDPSCFSRDSAAAGITWLVQAESEVGRHPEIHPERQTSRCRSEQGRAPEIAVKRLMTVEGMPMRGLHNAANAMAALALASAIDLPLAPMLDSLREYKGEPHRVELIATLNGVDFIDDSKGTNVGATVAALDGLGRRAVLIAGGDGKGQDFSPLIAPVSRWCCAVLLIGRDAARLRAVLAETGVPSECQPTLEAAVRAAANLARPGEIVLLSPACASLDMFRDYLQRAEVFRTTVAALAAGQALA